MPSCGTRCGEINTYEYRFGKFGDQQTLGSTNTEGIIFIELAPNTDYIFQVRALTSAGYGPYTENTTITTVKNPGKFMGLEQHHNVYYLVV